MPERSKGKAKPAAKPRAKPGAKPKAKATAKVSAKQGKAAAPKTPKARGKARSVAPPAKKGAAPRVIRKSKAAKAVSPEQAASAEVSLPPVVAQPYDEKLGELPERYYDDSFVSLPLGPDALFFYWDFKPETESSARQGLHAPRAVLTLYSSGRAVEHIDFALESRGYYVRSLAPGETYEAEIFFVGDNGERHRVGNPSNAVTLPPRGVSPLIDDHFISFPWGTPLGTAEHPYVAGPSGIARTPRWAPLGSSPTGPVGRGMGIGRPVPAR